MSNARELYGAKWREREHIVVLNAYFMYKGEAQHADSAFIQELSRVLGRTPHSILYRLQNYASIDPEETDPRRKGKAHVTEWVRRFFMDWSCKRESLSDAAEAFLRDLGAETEPDLFSSPPRIPITFHNYELLDEIGRGGFGVVLSCLDTKTQRTYAIKVIDGARLYDVDSLHRFRREIRALRSVRHDNVIRIYDDNLEIERGYPAYVMDLAECDLPQYLRRLADERTDPCQRPVLPFAEAKHLLLSVMAGAQALHEAAIGMIHRDINPNNILRMLDGRWVLADFSLVKFLPLKPVSTSFSTETRASLGTSHYAAPEQYLDLKNADRRSDIHALGWLIRDLFSSEGPYPRRHPSGLPVILERVFLKATEYAIDDRYQSLVEMKNDVEIALDELAADMAAMDARTL
jgi:serine/threonine-protein kinase